MSDTVHYYLNLNQIDHLRDAAYDDSSRTAMRDEVLVVILADFGLRVSEATQLRKSDFDFSSGYLELPGSIQKDYPTNSSPSMASLEIDPWKQFETARLLKRYFNSDWWQAQDNNYVFPSRQSEQISSRTARNIINRLAVAADVSPRSTGTEPTEPEDLHPHALRHSLACYALRDDDTRLFDVRQRLRHTNNQTTEDIYEHFTPR